MARTSYFDLTQAPPEYTELLGSRPPLNLYRMLPHAGAAAVGFLQLGGALLRRSELDPPLREIAILRVGMLSGASYEVHQHKRIAHKVGLAPAKIERLRPIAGRLGCSMAQLALAWCTKHPMVSSVITGASRREQVVENMGALDVIPLLSDDVVAEIEAAIG